jgi:hypothetical protein
MSYDDPFDPTLPNDYDDDDVFNENYNDELALAISRAGDQYARDEDSSSMSSMNSAVKKNRKLYEDAKKLDKGYGKMTIRVNHRNVPVEYYSTNDNPGSVIRNATTGIYETGNRFGSRAEDLFFKTSVSSGSNMRILFYDSPDEFERHFCCTVSDEVKRKWDEKSTKARALRVIEENARAERANVMVR